MITIVPYAGWGGSFRCIGNSIGIRQVLAILDADAREAALDAEANAREAALIAAVFEPPSRARRGLPVYVLLGDDGAPVRVAPPASDGAAGWASLYMCCGESEDCPADAASATAAPNTAAWSAGTMCCGESEDCPADAASATAASTTAAWPAGTMYCGDSEDCPADVASTTVACRRTSAAAHSAAAQHERLARLLDASSCMREHLTPDARRQPPPPPKSIVAAQQAGRGAGEPALTARRGATRGRPPCVGAGDRSASERAGRCSDGRSRRAAVSRGSGEAVHGGGECGWAEA